METSAFLSAPSLDSENMCGRSGILHDVHNEFADWKIWTFSCNHGHTCLLRLDLVSSCMGLQKPSTTITRCLSERCGSERKALPPTS